MKRLIATRAVHQGDKCDSPLCGEIIGRLAAVAHLDAKTGKESLFHVMCAPPPLRKAYHEGQRRG